MTLDEVMRELAAIGTASTKKTLLRHGAPEPLFGVRIGDLKPLQKKLRGQQELALQLYATKNYDAMYLAGLIADGAKMTRRQLDQWASGATWHAPAGYTVPWVASEHPQGIEIAMQWIDSPKELVATAGWSTLAAVAKTIPDDKLPIKQFDTLLKRCVRSITSAPNHVRYMMNSFVICVGTYVAPLADKALDAARKIGAVDVDMGDTDCQVPDAESYIIKSRRGKPVAPKRKTARC
ncbi:MAG: DNA alkylation repair protein [Planctomycetaceae bacterium]|nr:DNA alkylation repair protein [Planctomycetaceae bacterium]